MENDKTQLELLEQQKKELEIEVENLKEEAFLQQDNVDDLVGEDQSQTAIDNAIKKTRAAAHKWYEKEDELNRIKRKIKNRRFKLQGTKVAAVNKFSKGKKTEFGREISAIVKEDEDEDEDDKDIVLEAKKFLEKMKKKWPSKDTKGGKRRRRRTRRKTKKRRRKRRRTKKRGRKRRRTKKKRRRRR